MWPSGRSSNPAQALLATAPPRASSGSRERVERVERRRAFARLGGDNRSPRRDIGDFVLSDSGLERRDRQRRGEPRIGIGVIVAAHRERPISHHLGAHGRRDDPGAFCRRASAVQESLSIAPRPAVRPRARLQPRDVVAGRKSGSVVRPAAPGGPFHSRTATSAQPSSIARGDLDWAEMGAATLRPQARPGRQPRAGTANHAGRARAHYAARSAVGAQVPLRPRSWRRPGYLELGEAAAGVTGVGAPGHVGSMAAWFFGNASVSRTMKGSSSSAMPQAVDPRRDPAVGRRTHRERIEQKAELRPLLGGRDPQQVEHLRLQLGLVDPEGATGQLDPVADQVVGDRARRARIGVE